MDPGLRGQRALVTGGGSGHRARHRTRPRGRGRGRGDRGRRARPEVVSELRALGVMAVGLQADVSLENEVVRVVDEAAVALGGLDLYVNVAAGTWHEPLTRMTAPSWEQTLATNVSACVWGCREVARRFIAQRHGAIVAVGSTALVSAQPLETAYRASKAALKAHVEVAAVELAPHRDPRQPLDARRGRHRVRRGRIRGPACCGDPAGPDAAGGDPRRDRARSGVPAVRPTRRLRHRRRSHRRRRPAPAARSSAGPTRPSQRSTTPTEA